MRLRLITTVAAVALALAGCTDSTKGGGLVVNAPGGVGDLTGDGGGADGALGTDGADSPDATEDPGDSVGADSAAGPDGVADSGSPADSTGPTDGAEPPPDDATPGDATPGDATPDDATPDDATPDDATPDDATPGDATPDSSACTPGGCDDGDECTDDACGPGGCTHTPTGTCCEADEGCPEGAWCVGGTCIPACDAAALRRSSEGCDFWATDLDQYDESGLAGTGTENPPDAPWGVAVANPGPTPATLTFSSPDAQVQAALDAIGAPVVEPGGSARFILPSLDLSQPGISSQCVRVQSTQPVSVVQHNPIDHDAAVSADSSLLLPVHLLGTEHFATTWRSTPDSTIGIVFPGQRGTLTIIAVGPGTTQVTVTPTAQTAEGNGIPSIAAGAQKVFDLAQGTVLALEAAPPPLGVPSPTGDLTGTRVQSSKPVAVFAGHEEAAIAEPGAFETCCADHLEEQLLPVSAWGSDVLAAKSPPRADEQDGWRVIAGADGVTLTTTPPIAGLSGVTLSKGQWAEGWSSGSFRVQATGPVQVSQLLVGGKQVTPQSIGDPSLILAVPTAAFAARYQLDVPQSYPDERVTLVRQPGAQVRLDGDPVSGVSFTPVGGLEVGYLKVSPGPHLLTSVEPFGASLTGYGAIASHGHALGMRLP